MHSRSRPDLIGTEIVLGDWFLGEHFGEPSYEFFWDSAPLVYTPTGEAAVVFAQSWLMPLDGIAEIETSRVAEGVEA
jgi:hypothetical protein